MTNMQFGSAQRLSEHSFSSEFVSFDLRNRDSLSLSNPVVSFTHFFMSAAFFPPHPHAGFSAITYIFEHSKNGFWNRDSMGNAGPINPGELHWTLAGRGVMHEEKPITPHIVAEGLQIFVNMKEKNKNVAPAAFHVSNQNAPRFTEHGLSIKLLSGSHAGRSAGFHLPEPTQILDIIIDQNGVLEVGSNQGGLVYVYQGELDVQIDTDWITVSEKHSLSFLSSASDRKINLRVKSSSRFIAIYGEPTNEPVIARGPFIMTTIEGIESAEKRFRAGEMGTL